MILIINTVKAVLEQNSSHASYALFYDIKSNQNKSHSNKSNKDVTSGLDGEGKYPFKWTLIGVVVLSALFWFLVYKIFF
ncbi:hypothetical protein [Pseudaquidulcibacter saccharophilus]|uniref:hypothetical protein n=1 Tax=Pseudaquidulcibacter saccharophilus TaxID=2831900 RepID=UPI001EFF1832|nr:hypothetical protein [Pseudaquidulcibacter saccharophilus]